jgi:hypothetical protein
LNAVKPRKALRQRVFSDPMLIIHTIWRRPKKFKERIENIEDAPKNKPGVALVTTYTEPLSADVSALEKTCESLGGAND